MCDRGPARASQPHADHERQDSRRHRGEPGRGQGGRARARRGRGHRVCDGARDGAGTEVGQNPVFAAAFEQLGAAVESPWLAGRAVAALTADRQVLTRSGQVLVAAELAAQYGFTDLDGSRSTSIRELLAQMQAARG